MPAQATRWGWHRLDSRWARQFVDGAQVGPRDLVLDVGAGDGAITGLLLATGATVVAFELHPGRAATLRRRFAGQRLTVVQADVSDLRLPRRPFKVVSNPPFAITTALLRRLLHPGSRLQRADLVLPHWATMRWAAGRGGGGLASRSTFRLEVGMRVPPRAFHPPPPAPAAILTATRKTGPGSRAEVASPSRFSYFGSSYRGMLRTMKVDKVSVSFPPELGDAIRTAAAKAGKPLSAWLAQAAAAKLRAEALAELLDDWTEEFGPLTDAELAEARRSLQVEHPAADAAP